MEQLTLNEEIMFKKIKLLFQELSDKHYKSELHLHESIFGEIDYFKFLYNKMGFKRYSGTFREMDGCHSSGYWFDDNGRIIYVYSPVKCNPNIDLMKKNLKWKEKCGFKEDI